MRADGRDGLGPIPTGRGGVNQAFSDNAEMILDNPASMVNVKGDGLCELGVATTITTSNYSDSYGNDVNSKVRPQPGPVLGITKKTPDGQWAFGVGLFAPSAFGTSYGQLNNPTFGPNVMSSRGDLVKLLPAMAYRATDRLALGFSLGVGLSYASLDGPQFLQSGPLAGVPVLLDSQGTGVAPIGALGMQYQLTDKTRIGATYTAQSNFWLRGATNATFFDGSLVESRFHSKIHLRWPRTLAFGVKHDLCPHRRIAADLVWTDWASAFSDVNLVMYDPSNPAIQALLAGAGGSLPIKQKLPLRWTDTVTFRLGYETDLSEVDVLRCGYDYDPNPSPNATFNPYFGGGRQHVFSLGFSHKLQRAQRAIFNAAYQYAFGPTRHVGASALVGGQFDNSTYQADAHYATMSLSIPY
jgi:long-subunit fatty acid transport protein